MSLEFDTVSYTYPGASHGISDISLKAAPAELLAVIGQSGSGKSTLLRLTAGLLTGYAGRIVIGDHDVAEQPVWKRGVGMVFQQYALFPHLSVTDNVAYGLRMRGIGLAERRRQALAMLERVGLTSHAGQLPSQLSGGQQQRVALARALVIEPRVLLLDEPLAALDAGIRHQLRDEIRTLQRACGATTLLVTHDQDEALSMADRSRSLTAAACCRSVRRANSTNSRSRHVSRASSAIRRSCPGAWSRLIASMSASRRCAPRPARCARATPSSCCCAPNTCKLIPSRGVQTASTVRVARSVISARHIATTSSRTAPPRPFLVRGARWPCTASRLIRAICAFCRPRCANERSSTPHHRLDRSWTCSHD
ncbi:ABC transporter family protein [Paraburkholderia sp. BL17N1]|nr:ABC transporter family protein [Paraburkholderia sp. BL17N1]